MATIAEFRFEGAAGDGWNSSQGAIDTGVFYEGAQSIYFDCTGSTKQNQLSIAAGKRIITGRFYYRIKTDTSGTASIIQADNANGACIIQARVGRKLRVLVNGGTASVDSAALNLNQWYRIDFKFDSSTGTTSIVWKIDGTDQTGATKAQTAADLTNFRLGNTGTNTYQNFFDALKITDQAGDYPLGPYVFTVGALGLIDASKAIYAPTVAPKYSIGALALLDGASAIYAPTVSPQAVTVGALPLLDGGKAIYAPTVAPQAVTIGALGLIDSGSAIYAPALEPGPVTAEIPLLDGARAIYAPSLTVGAVDVTLGFLESLPDLYAPSIQPGLVVVEVGLLDGGRAIYAPGAEAIPIPVLELPTLDAGALIYPLRVSLDQRRRTIVLGPRRDEEGTGDQDVLIALLTQG